MAKEKKEIRLTTKQRIWLDEYMVHFNASRAAVAAGYSKHTAPFIGAENLNKPQLKAEISRRLSESQITPDQTKKLIGDIATASLNEYMVTKKVEVIPKIRKSIPDYIIDLEGEIEDEQKFIKLASLEGEELESSNNKISKLQKKVLRLQIKYDRDPTETILVDGKPIETEVTELDLTAIAKDKERGRIKSFRMTKDGPVIEMYAADGALRDIARIHGLYEKDNEQQRDVIAINIDSDDSALGSE